MNTSIKTDVVVIGGGATGAGILRDLTLRGVSAVLVEKGDIAEGTTGRNHGLLHSGARYAVKDIESARECISENKILKKIARHCIEDTKGLFVTLPEDDPSYHDQLLSACRFAGIPVKAINRKKALSLEPNLNPNLLSAMIVPDGTIDPFRLTTANIQDSVERGNTIHTYTKITGFIMKENVIEGITCENRQGAFSMYAKMIVNASGVWAQEVCQLAGVELSMMPSKGSMVIIDYRINNIVVNRCRKPSDGDIIVPGDTVSLIGTTSKTIDYVDIEDYSIDDDEIDVLLRDGEKLLPSISKARVLRAYAGVRPLLAVSGEAKGRNISRGIILIDHEKRDNCKNLITIVGGKLMTYRLMAEMTADLVCEKLAMKTKCTTHKEPLPGSEKKISREKSVKKYTGVSRSVVGSTLYRHGLRVFNILKGDKRNYRVICECEMVTEGELEYAVKNLEVQNLVDIRRRTRMGMGPCQGELCAYRTAGLYKVFNGEGSDHSVELLKEFLEERWHGIKPVLWGDALKEVEFTYWIYEGLFGLGNIDFKSNREIGNKEEDANS